MLDLAQISHFRVASLGILEAGILIANVASRFTRSLYAVKTLKGQVPPTTPTQGKEDFVSQFEP